MKGGDGLGAELAIPDPGDEALADVYLECEDESHELSRTSEPCTSMSPSACTVGGEVPVLPSTCQHVATHDIQQSIMHDRLLV